MSTITRLKPDCPPDAHKVMRPPENKVSALLCVKVTPDQLQKYGPVDVMEVLALMSDKANLCCSKEVFTELEQAAAAENAEMQKARDEGYEGTDKPLFPNFVEVSEDGSEAAIVYAGGARSSQYKFVDLSEDFNKVESFLKLLGEECLICVDMLSMLILRSISTVYPWDKLLAGDFVRQYLKAAAALKGSDRELLTDIRYGRRNAEIKQDYPEAYAFLRLERKLFLQYPSED